MIWRGEISHTLMNIAWMSLFKLLIIIIIVVVFGKELFSADWVELTEDIWLMPRKTPYMS